MNRRDDNHDLFHPKPLTLAEVRLEEVKFVLEAVEGFSNEELFRVKRHVERELFARNAWYPNEPFTPREQA